MEYRTMKVLFSALVGLGLGAIFTGLGAAYAVNIFGLIGVLGLLYGTVGTTACLFKGAVEHKNYKEVMKSRDLDVSKSFGPVTSNEKERSNNTEIENTTQQDFINELTDDVDLDKKAVYNTPKISKKTKLMECLEPSEDKTQER